MGYLAPVSCNKLFRWVAGWAGALGLHLLLRCESGSLQSQATLLHVLNPLCPPLFLPNPACRYTWWITFLHFL